MTDHTDLIAELEAAPEGGDKLDRAIAIAANISWSPDEGGQFGGYGLLPRRVWFSRSLDAARSLIQEGVEYSLTNLNALAMAEVGLNLLNGPEMSCREDGNEILALCAAAMKARKAS